MNRENYPASAALDGQLLRDSVRRGYLCSVECSTASDLDRGRGCC